MASPIKPTLTDSQLMISLMSGDQSAFTEVYIRYWAIMYAHVYRMLRDEEEAKDTVQEIFSNLWLKSANLTSDTNLAGFLYISARNRVFNLIEQKKIRNGHLVSIAKFMNEVSTSTLDQLNENDLAAAIEREVRLLPPRMREIFELSRNNSLSHKEVGEHLNLSPQTVKKQIQNALRILKPRLKDVITGLFILFFLK